MPNQGFLLPFLAFLSELGPSAGFGMAIGAQRAMDAFLAEPEAVQ